MYSLLRFVVIKNYFRAIVYVYTWMLQVKNKIIKNILFDF